MVKNPGPQFVRYFAPVVEALKELGGSGRPVEVRDLVAKKLSIVDQERSELLETGQPRFDNQVHWARFYLVKGGYVDSSKRGVWSLTEKGRGTVAMSFDQAMQIFRQVQSQFPKEKSISIGVTADATAPDNSLAFSDISPISETSYRTKLLDLVKSLPPAGFERLCQRLLRESGFEQVVVTGRSGDGGIDGHGVLLLNPFVSFKVLFQCKRYSGTVTASQVRDFRGAMTGRTDKGIILTTGTFTADAQKEALRDGAPSVELVDGNNLLDMFESLELGLIPRKTYDLDHEFFTEFQN